MNAEQTQELWQVEANGQVFDTNFAEMTSWIDQGTLLRQDKVRKGNLRWIEAGKVPSLVAVFNAKVNGEPLPAPVVTVTKLSPTTIPGNSSTNPPNLTAPLPPSASAEPTCSVHADIPAAYQCGTCFSDFCKACPNSYGGTVKICPYCGALCNAIAKPESSVPTYRSPSAAPGSSFGFGDFFEAMAYPFKFKASLILGAIMFTVFSIGQTVVGFGGIFMLSSAIFCFMLANTLTFGILSNTVENFAQGKIGLNFMPTFDDFSLWDDVVQPFFLMIGVYISSFGPTAVLLIAAIFFVSSAAKPEMNGLQSDAARAVNPDLPYAANAASQSQRVREILQKDADEQKRRVAALEDRDIQPDVTRDPNAAKDQDEVNFERMNQMIQAQRKAQLESAVGKAPDTVAKERTDMIKKLVGYGVVFLLALGVCLIWGFFYFPAACAVAGYTHSFGATLNPSVGIDTIRRLGGDYVKILLMCLLIAVISGFITGIIGLLLSPFDMPGVGNVPAKAIASVFGFYFSVVFACVIGFALYKASDRLSLPGA